MNYRIILSIACLFFVACTNPRNKGENDKWEEYAQEIIKSHIGTYLSFPNHVSSPFFSQESIDSILCQDAKIVFNVDIDCGSCLIKFSFWEQFAENLYRKHKIQLPILAFINTTSSQTITNRVKKHWKYKWVYDPKYEFIDKNSLHDDRFQAALLDKNNKIIIIGNPMHNKKLENLYEQAIVKFATKKD